MAIVFPASPSVNDTFTEGSITYKWDGAKWIGLGVTPADRLVEGSNKLEIDGSNNLVWTGNNVGIGTDNPSFHLHVSSDSNTALGVYSTQTTGGQFQVATLKLRTYETSSNTVAAGDFLLTGKNTITFGGANRFIMRGDTGVSLGFYTDNTERLSITSGGEVQIANGNLKFSTAGTGIDFSANANATGMTSELLDDYEEGTWTPVIKSGTNTITATGGNQHYTYTKVGNKVTVYFALDGATTSGTTGGDFTIQGLPFSMTPILAGNRTMGSVLMYYSSGLRAAQWPVWIHLNQSSTTLDIYEKSAVANNYGRATVGQVGAQSYVFGQITYNVE